MLDLQDIEKVVSKHRENAELRLWQKELAFRVVEIIHGTHDAEISSKISEFLFWETDKLKLLWELNDTDLNSFYTEIWWFKYSWENLFETIVKSWLAPSNSEARKSIQSWAIFINEEKITEFNYDFEKAFENHKVILLRKGKKSFRLIVR
jgi:tyrosyl-tRNA synthetase